MAKESVETTTRLELRVVSAPYDLACMGELIKLRENRDAAVLVLITTMGRTIVHEQIVAVATDTPSFLRLRAYASADGAITLHRDLA